MISTFFFLLTIQTGDALLLIRREDVLNRFSLKLGAALRLYTHIVELQYKNNNPIIAWNEFY